jgi:hypothetical protein
MAASTASATGRSKWLPSLEHVRRRQVDEYPFRRQRQAHRRQRRPHPLPRLADRLVGKPHHQKCRQAGGDLHLNLDRLRIDPGKGKTLNPRDAHDQNTRIGCMLRAARERSKRFFFCRKTGTPGAKQKDFY